MAQVVIEHLVKNFIGPSREEIRALRDVTLSIEDKELMVLVGPSGSGKSTLLRIIAGLDEPTVGTISIEGKPMDRVRPEDRDVAMVFQNYALYPHMTARENIAFGLKLRKFSKLEIQNRIAAAAEILGLGQCLDRMPSALSGGERQRVALGRALVHKPKVFLLDEPLSNLDATMRSRMRVELAKLHSRLDATVIYVTHDQTEAMTLGHRLAVIREGVIQQVAPPLEIYSRPANLFVAGFIGSPSMNFIQGRVRSDQGRYFFSSNVNSSSKDSGILQLLLPENLKSKFDSNLEREVILGIRPEDIAATPVESASERPAHDTGSSIHAMVEVIESRGPESILHVKAGDYEITARAHRNFKGQPGQLLSLTFDFASVQFFDVKTGNALT